MHTGRWVACGKCVLLNENRPCELFRGIWAPAGEEGGRRSALPTLENPPKMFSIYSDISAIFLLGGGVAFLLCFSPYIGPFHHVGAFSQLFSLCEELNFLSHMGPMFSILTPPLQINLKTILLLILIFNFSIYFFINLIYTQGCQLSRIWRDSHAFDLLLTHSRNCQIYSRIFKKSHAYSRNLKNPK